MAHSGGRLRRCRAIAPGKSIQEAIPSRRGFSLPCRLASSTLQNYRYAPSGIPPGRSGPSGSLADGPQGSRSGSGSALHELTKLVPVAILAEALGYHPTTIERHAVDSATAYSRYVAAVRSG